MNVLKSMARLVVAASAAFGLLGATSAAIAQYGDPAYCSNVAWTVCSYDENGRPIQVSYECYEAEYQACMDGYGGSLGAFKE